MSTYCGVYGCWNNSRAKPHLSFYRLPKDEDRRRSWIKVMRREELLTKTQSRHFVCSEHFSRESIRNKRLKPGAVPEETPDRQEPVAVEIKQEPTALPHHMFPPMLHPENIYIAKEAMAEIKIRRQSLQSSRTQELSYKRRTA